MNFFMNIEVQFCMMWNYAPKAASFAEEIFDNFRTEVDKLELVPSSGGAFEVIVNGEKIYSKLQTGEFPNNEEVIAKLKQFK